MNLLTFVGIVLTVSLTERLVTGAKISWMRRASPYAEYERSVEEKDNLEPEVTRRQIAYTGFNPSSGVYTVLSPNYNTQTQTQQDYGNNDPYSWGDFSQFGPNSNGYPPSSGYDYPGSGGLRPSVGSLDGLYHNLWDQYNHHGLGQNNGQDFDNGLNNNGYLHSQEGTDSGELVIPPEESLEDHTLVGHVSDTIGQTVDTFSTNVQSVFGK